LFRKHIAPRKPDITVLYVGGYNDYVPAIGESDGERGARLQAEHNSLWRRWRLVRLCARILAPKPKLSRAEYVAAFERGEAPDGRRVPVADLQENMEALIREAKEVGSKVLVLVPPLPADTLQKHRVALEYRAVVRYVTRRSGDEPVDPTAAFAGRAVQQEFNLPEHQRAYWPCFVDWVHPSVLGHHLVADWLQQALRNDNFRLTPAPDCMAFGNLEPRSVVGGRKSHVIATEDNNRWGADTASRAMVGRWWVPDWEPVFGAQASVSVRLDLPPTIPPGTYPVRLITDLGVTTCPAPLVVEPPPLTAEISRKGNTLTLRFQITGPKGWPVGVWVSTDKRRVPAPTRFGPFHLVANPDGRPAGFRHDTPFMFLRLELPQVAGTIPADGTWRHQTEVDLSKLGTIPDQVHVQGLLHRDEAHGILTDVVTLAVPR
ncbi:MAG: SGNH/GDSL hydrolase family protein, partial [Planctomycetota bacterium]